ncbi:anti-sigma factor family protein [Nocardioides terrigena]|uniref:anti-sigma factor family protein n=1 Tax=Nocardioides terrigena TaxID=424797 RepID=UPI000D31AD8B|nr:zf-HC2 domain-containing protein [Nocardioides terrigena]
MTCPFAHDGAAYVLGALSPGDRLALERHLPGCESCTRAVREVAGLPGLLDRVDAGLLEHPPADEPLPDTLLPALTRSVRRSGRRRTLVAAGLAAAFAAVAFGVPALLSGGDDGREPSSVAPSPTATEAPVPDEPMSPVGDVPVEATVGLEQVTWGTRLLLTCTYEPESVEYELPPTVDYTIVVRTRDGHTEQVGSWRSVGGMTMRLTAGTSSDRDDIRSVEVRTTSGRVVLRLRA